MTNEIDDALAAAAALVKTIAVTNPPDERVWILPAQTDAIEIGTRDVYPAAVISKLNSDVGAWRADSFGAGRHQWTMLIAVYIAEGPIVVTAQDEGSRLAMQNASEWYKAMADLLYANMSLTGTVDIIGDEDGNLYEYVTDNIIWDGRQYYGHLFFVPVVQTVIQGMSQ